MYPTAIPPRVLLEPGTAFSLHTPLGSLVQNQGKDSALPDLARLFCLPPRSFCQEHRPAQTVQACQDGQTSCVICLEHVEEQLSYRTMVCLNCRQAWFHRGCIQVRGPSCACWARQVPGSRAPLTLLVSLLQQEAFHAGLLCFRCPQCNDREKFLPEMSFLGIQVPSRLVLFCPSAVPPRQMNCAGPAHRLSARALSPTAVAADRRTGDPRQGRSRPQNLPGYSSHTSTQLLASMLLWGKGRPCFPPSVLPSSARPLTKEAKMVWGSERQPNWLHGAPHAAQVSECPRCLALPYTYGRGGS